ncbi:MAG: FAD/NAD(P)-binding oxidoreductase [Dehalococcoidia bacterium]
MAGKTIIVLGGGVGGLVTASELRKRLSRRHRVVLIDRSDKHVFWPSLLWLQVGLRKPNDLVRDLARLNRKGIEVVNGQVTAIDPERRSVQVAGDEMTADYLVVSLGAELAPEQAPGLEQAGHNLYSLAGATAIRDARVGLTQGALAVVVAKLPFKCPAAPYEAAMLLDHDLRKRKVRERVTVALYSPEPGPMGVTGPVLSAAVRGLLEQRQIAYHPKHELSEVDAGGKRLRFANGAEAAYDFLVYIPPHVAPPAVRDAGLVGDSGWVTVDRHTMETSFSGVYAIGDVTGIPLSMGLPLPKAGVFAHRQGQAVARRIAAQVAGKDAQAVFDGHGECFIEVGGGRAGMGHGDFYGEPTPQVRLREPSRLWHMGKVFFEKRWLWKWF